MKENCHNSRLSDDVNMKLGPVTKMTRETTSKKSDDEVMSANCEIMVIFQIGAIRKLDSERIVSKTYIFINSNLLSYKNWKQK